MEVHLAAEHPKEDLADAERALDGPAEEHAGERAVVVRLVLEHLGELQHDLGHGAVVEAVQLAHGELADHGVAVLDVEELQHAHLGVLGGLDVLLALDQAHAPLVHLRAANSARAG